MTTDKRLHIGPGVDLPLSVVTAKAAILAMTGQGKTYLAKVMAEEMLNHGVQIVVGDYTGVWWGLTSSANGKKEGYNVVVFGGDHADVPINEHSGALIADLVVNERVSAVLDVSGFEHDAEKIRFMTAFARRLYFKNKRPLHFFLDEADEFVPQSPQRDQIAMFSVLKRIWQRGRVKGIGGTLISQRSAVVNKSLLSQSEMLIALRTVGPQDRAALESWFSSWGTPEQIKKFEGSISNLSDHFAWFWSPKHQLFVTGKARTLTTFDSGATPDVDAGLAIDEPTKRTQHDIARFGKEIEKLALDAAADDPAILRKQAEHYRAQFEIGKERILILEKLLSAREKRTTVTRDKPVKVPAISPRTLKEIGKARKALAKARTAIGLTVVDVQQATDRLERDLERAEGLIIPSPDPAGIGDPGGTGRIIPSTAVPAGAFLPGGGLYGPGRGDGDAKTPVPAGSAGAGGPNGDGAGGSVTGGRRRILAALAQHGRMTYGRVRVLAGIQSTDTLNTYIRALKRAGFVIENSGSVIVITDAGRVALGHYDPLPTGAALVEYWKGQIGSAGKGQIFRALLERPNYAFDAGQLMKAAGIQSGDTLMTYVRALKVLGLVEYVGKAKMIKLASEFGGI